jgi:lysophospholipase L1-like esterase
MSRRMLVRQLKVSSFALLASGVLFFAACGESANSPGTTTGGGGAMASAGAPSGGGAVNGGGGSTSSAGSNAMGGGTAGVASSGAAGTANAGTAGVGGGMAGSGGAGGGVGGSSGNGGGAGRTAGNGGGGGSAGAGGAAAFQPCPASGSCKIMPFGDSITQGYNVVGGYRAPLYHLALAAQHDITFVGSANDYSVATVDGKAFPKNHEGHGGYTIEGNLGIAQFVSSSIPNFKPNIITLMIGTNDINGNNNVADAPNRLGKLLDSIFMRDANILVVLAQIVPTGSDGTNNAVKTYNAAIPNLVSTRTSKGQHIVLVDMYTAFTKDANYKQSLMGDNLHPNQAGYNLMADVWFAALSPYLH